MLAAGIVPLFIAHPATAGNGEILEIALAGLGALLGLVAACGLMKVSYDSASQQSMSVAGPAYAAFWTLVIGARLLFTYGANHWYHNELGHWLSPTGSRSTPSPTPSSSWPSPWPSPGPSAWPWAGPRCAADPPTSWRSDMTFTTIAIALAVFVVVLAKRVRGETVREPKKLFLLPIVVGLIGVQNVSHAKPNAIDIAVIAAGAAISLGLGFLRGKFDRVTLADGSPFMSWTAASIAVFAGNVVAKLALDAAGVAAGGTSSALSSSILLNSRAHLAGRSGGRVVPLPVAHGAGAQPIRGPWDNRRLRHIGWLGKRPVPWDRAEVRPAHQLAHDPVSERSESIYLISYGGRYVRAVRLVFLAVIFGTAFLGRPHPSLTGNGLVILVSLTVAAATHVVLTVAPSGSAAMKATTVLAAVSSGVVAGYEPSVGTAVLLVFVGLSAGAGLEFGQGCLVTALAVVATAISVLAAGQGTGNIALGAIAVVGFLGATGRKQYVLRAEEAELRLADAERAREEHARAAGLAERANAAREIHDILAHSLGALVLQLDALDAVLSGETPDHARAGEVLARARSLAVEGLNEARQAVGSLRADPPPLADALRHVDRRHPRRDVGDHRTAQGGPGRGSGGVATDRTGRPDQCSQARPGGSDDGASRFAPCEVVLSVTDTGGLDGGGPGPLAHTGGGYGIEGLRERAELLGGTLVAGPHGAGWQVTLRVPEARLANEHAVETQ